MKTTIAIYPLENQDKMLEITNVNYYGNSLELQDLDWQINTLVEQSLTLPEILFITSFPPRECGIATYTQDLVAALNLQFENSFSSSICALESNLEKPHYTKKPKFILNTNSRKSFIKTAAHINNDCNIKLVLIQHEFGFFAQNENDFKLLFDTIEKPIVFVYHTVLPNPNPELKKKVEEMSAVASAIIVMTSDAANILNTHYDVCSYKIKVIAHGTHLVPPLDSHKLKEKYHLSGRKVLTTFGLLSSSKSIETTLDALPNVIKFHPEVMFLILGKTHPSVVKNEGETYRNMLEEKVLQLNIQNHVTFINEYSQLPVLLEYLQLSDVYLFTSKDPNQAVSGTFSYAVSSGCPVISTPIPHAKEVLNNGNGIIVDFENPKQLAKAINSLLNNDALRAQISSNSFQLMAATAWENSAIAHALVFKELSNHCFDLHYKLPDINLKHIKKMTSHKGIIQFSKISSPDIHSGYTLDDNSRALISLCQHYSLFQDKNDIILIDRFLGFISICMQEDGSFLNYVNEEGEFTGQNYQNNLEDCTGRAIWALGFVVSQKNILPLIFIEEANNILEKALPHLTSIHSTRAMAFIIKGLHYQNDAANMGLLETFAKRLVQMYKHEKNYDWHWFEAYLTYGNSVLPEALLCAYESTQNIIYKNIALESFNFLLSKIFVGNQIKVISNQGWEIKDNLASSIPGGEQPIDVAYTIITLEKFYHVFNKNNYKEKAKLAFDWFLGQNHLHQIVYNPCTGGCYDGVEEHNINMNQGAESTISYLLSRLAIERLYPREISNYKEVNIMNLLVGIA